MADTLESVLVVDALNMAPWNRRPKPGLIHHTDRGCQYTSLAFGRRCREAGILAILGARVQRLRHSVQNSTCGRRLTGLIGVVPAGWAV